MTPKPTMFSPIRLGALNLSHRMVLAPLTRMRALDDSLCVDAETVSYYEQRATPGGMLISEAVNISPEAIAELKTPGIWTEDQVRSWKPVVDAVHAKSGIFTMQLWHTGRAGGPSLPKLLQQPLIAAAKNKPCVSASDVPMVSRKRGPFTPPRPLPIEEIPRLLEDYKHAARNALRAGVDAVEIHAAHGYLINQFMCTSTNKRTDAYGGSLENRSRLLFQVVEAVASVVGMDRVGVRLSPTTKESMHYYQCKDEDPEKLYAYVIKNLNKYQIAYLQLSEPRWLGEKKTFGDDPGVLLPLFNPQRYQHLFDGPIIGTGGFTPITSQAAIEEGKYDLIAFGRWFISNPDLLERIRSGEPLNRYNRETFYSHAPGDVGEGYTDYPDVDGSVGKVDKYPLVDQKLIGKSLASSNL